MFTYDDLRGLLQAQPFVPFRLVMSDGAAVEIRHRELVMPGRRFALVGIPDSAKPEAPFDKWTVVWYMHVTRVEMLDTGKPPFSPPPPETPSPATR